MLQRKLVLFLPGRAHFFAAINRSSSARLARSLARSSGGEHCLGQMPKAEVAFAGVEVTMYVDSYSIVNALDVSD